MKKMIVVLILSLLVCGNIYAQVEAGDKEVSVMGYYSTIIGDEDYTYGFGSLQLSYGSYLNKYLQIGIAPILSFSTTKDENNEDFIDVQFSGSIFFNLNLATTSKTIPYITGQYYQQTFDIDEDAEEKFTDYSFINVGIGVKSFFNEYAAFNTQVSYGFSLKEDAEYGILTIMTGLTVLF